ncbi:TM2 domain-containing membrane protein YozV [Bacillus benzoevorans]|uniref:TM2 domain-containing membrane protein YozV n=1 Tax=Bacillus benzoevorans TaxID=1456 RepID=A0A7X0LYY2_9BACI|nr:TM2 domain-containing membrane protein YozV [Bacillus benzoevorans]
MKRKEFEVVLWSIALPGFGQILNQQIFKGTLLSLLELLVKNND